MERAFSHSREHGHHGIVTVFLIHLTEIYNFGTVGEELSSQETVDEEHVSDYIQKIEYLKNKTVAAIIMFSGTVAVSRLHAA